jgi:hypothetical protein
MTGTSTNRLGVLGVVRLCGGDLIFCCTYARRGGSISNL